MNWIQDGIGQLTPQTFLIQKENLDQLLKEHDPPDLIIDCSEELIASSQIHSLFEKQKENQRCLVLVIPINFDHSFSEQWVVVPTLLEAVDFISFERIQRDLGF
ncbi:MAG: hypothetical protein VW080_07160 [Flavobacteriaceae bacterium]